MDERGISNTPKSLSMSSRLSEANTTSEKSVGVSERREHKHMPARIATRDAAVEAQPGVVESRTNGSESQPTKDAKAMSSKPSSIFFMRPRYSRRVQSRSEPSHTSPAPDSVKCIESPAESAADTKVTSTSPSPVFDT
ncbi:heavy metal tolerance [Trichoderma cornu-damae]|uniref:Heavy metal tolerance n=1 Tax=Trichoderma cornu-damae TaxID=654480 RepID=A0A9P8U016_9HYPO|nr:heavy metal tolerance [Trichoderma cornu-damae]